MLQTVTNEFNNDMAILYANNQCDRNESEIDYEELIENNDYILITDPIKRIADMNY